MCNISYVVSNSNRLLFSFKKKNSWQWHLSKEQKNDFFIKRWLITSKQFFSIGYRVTHNMKLNWVKETVYAKWIIIMIFINQTINWFDPSLFRFVWNKNAMKSRLFKGWQPINSVRFIHYQNRLLNKFDEHKKILNCYKRNADTPCLASIFSFIQSFFFTPW